MQQVLSTRLSNRIIHILARESYQQRSKIVAQIHMSMDCTIYDNRLLNDAATTPQYKLWRLYTHGSRATDMGHCKQQMTIDIQDKQCLVGDEILYQLRTPPISGQ